MIAISKSDMLDKELKAEMTTLLDGELPVDYVFISSVAQTGLVQLKDSLWAMLNP